MLAARRIPPVLPRLEPRERAVREGRPLARLEGVAQRLRDRVARPVAQLEQPLARGTAAAGQAVAPTIARRPTIGRVPRELDAELLQPVDRALRITGEDLDEPHVRAV